MSQTTKKALAASLKKMMETKPLSKITVTDITEDCEINRHTFYYHFQDIYDLVEWIYHSEAEKALDGKKTYDTWQEGFVRLFDYALQNKKFIMGTFRSISKEHLMHYLYTQASGLLGAVVEEQAEGMKLAEKYQSFVTDFYTYAFVGIALRWIEDGMKESPEMIVGMLSRMIQGEIKESLRRFCGLE